MLAVVFTSGALAMFLVKADGSKFDTSTLPPGSLISCVSWSPKGNYLISTAKWIWDSFIFSSIKPKLDMGLFVDFCVFTCFYQFLHDVLIKLFCFDLQNNFMSTSCKNQLIYKNQQSIRCQVLAYWIKYGAVSYSLSFNYRH